MTLGARRGYPAGNAMKPLADPAGTRLPIKRDTTSNGEFVPVPLSQA
jgi:hypothetical protein